MDRIGLCFVKARALNIDVGLPSADSSLTHLSMKFDCFTRFSSCIGSQQRQDTIRSNTEGCKPDLGSQKELGSSKSSKVEVSPKSSKKSFSATPIYPSSIESGS